MKPLVSLLGSAERCVFFSVTGVSCEGRSRLFDFACYAEYVSVSSISTEERRALNRAL